MDFFRNKHAYEQIYLLHSPDFCMKFNQLTDDENVKSLSFLFKCYVMYGVRFIIPEL